MFSLDCFFPAVGVLSFLRMILLGAAVSLNLNFFLDNRSVLGLVSCRFLCLNSSVLSRFSACLGAAVLCSGLISGRTVLAVAVALG